MVAHVRRPSARASSRPPSPGAGAGRCTAPGVREKRGAGAGCTMPSSSRYVSRARMCGCAGASSSASTGVTHASVACEQRGPFVARLALEHVRERTGLRIPARIGRRRDAEPFVENREELRLERRDGDVAAVGTFVAAIVRRRAAQQAALAVEREAARRRHPAEERHQRRGAVDDCGVDHLPATGSFTLEQRRDDAECEI